MIMYLRLQHTYVHTTPDLIVLIRLEQKTATLTKKGVSRLILCKCMIVNNL